MAGDHSWWLEINGIACWRQQTYFNHCMYFNLSFNKALRHLRRQTCLRPNGLRSANKATILFDSPSQATYVRQNLSALERSF